MAWFSSTRGTWRRIQRTSDWINRAPTQRRRRPERGRPVGPKLVRGRGLARRRTDWARLARLLFSWLLAAGLTMVIFRIYVVRVLAG